MQIVIKKEVAEIREISVPAFFKDVDLDQPSRENYFAVLDEETQVSLLVLASGYTSIQHSPIYINEVTNAYNRMDLCTEEEFLSAYNKAHESIRLAPVIKTGMLYDEEKVEALRNSIAL